MDRQSIYHSSSTAIAKAWGFDCSGPGLPRRRFEAILRARVLHVVVLVLDFMYLGRFPNVEEMQRRPNACQLEIFGRLQSLIAVCGSTRDEFPMVPGRSGPKLAASLMHLERFVAGCKDFGDQYLRSTCPDFYEEDSSLFPLEEYPQLVPYRDLNASRLRLVGKGKWRMEEYLSGPFWLPFVEPSFLLHGRSISGATVPSFEHESPEECFRLAKVWDVNGLLALFASPVKPGYFCKVFQVFKSEQIDRQIGDRRLPNASEFHVDGPSKHLPPGHLLTQLHVRRGSHRLLGSVTDRRDFYHQACVSLERAQTNMLPFKYPPDSFKGTKGYDDLISRHALKKSKDRQDVGDLLGKVDSKVPSRRGVALPCDVYPAFKSLFQGDHLGVEFALSAHQGFLEEFGVLEKENQILGHETVPFGPKWCGLVIDDFFVISEEHVSVAAAESASFHSLQEARLAYDKEKVEGSTEKDIVASDRFKAAGAEVISDPKTVRLGLTLVGAPIAKRFALSVLSLRAAALPSITPLLASRLSGNWVSALLYRRCLSAVVEEFFALGAGLEKPDSPKLVPLTRNQAQELTLLSCLAPVMCSNVAARFSRKIFASDASNNKGAFVVTEVQPDVSRALWQVGDKKGAYTRLQDPVRACLKNLVSELEVDEELPFGLDSGPFKAPLLYFDFVEIFGGAGVVSKAAGELGLVVAPVLDLSDSKHYDLRDLRLLEWCIYMIDSGRFASFLLEPPCTTFSPAAHPCVRSYKQPLGFDRKQWKTLLGNTTAFRSFVLLRVGRNKRRPCGMEQPFLSKMAWLSFWMSLLEAGFEECRLASCQFGSIHKKEFRFLLYLVSAEELETRCPGGHEHVRVEGSYTKGSATYVPALAMHIAKGFRKALRLARLADEESEPRLEGFESPLVNDVLLSSAWKLGRVWCWKKKSHINVLETWSATASLCEAAQNEPDCRHSFLLDSNVAKSALAKGRSSAYSLQPVLKRAASVQLAFGSYPSWNFAPTRLNVSDDPTRDKEIRKDDCASAVLGLELGELVKLHECRLRRFAANWIRLVLLLSSSGAVAGEETRPLSYGFSQTLDFGLHFTWISLSQAFGLCAGLLCLRYLWISRNFGICGLLLRFLLLSLILCKGDPVDGFGAPGRLASLHFPLVACAAMEPSSAAERERAALRSTSFLPADRLVRKQTRDRRKKLLLAFRSWLWREHAVSYHALINGKPVDAEKVSNWLVIFGRELFTAGKSYNQFSETINAVAMVKPLLRRQLTPAWDLAFSWLSGEPHQHHPALPVSVLLAMMTIALIWGWIFEASILGLTWAGVLRIGEVLNATRDDLILPCDAAPGMLHVLLCIRDPKTKGRAARHQSARVDQPDLVDLLSAVYGPLHRDTRLWPQSSATLRKRFSALLTALKLPCEKSGNSRPFDLASLRPGGATWMLGVTENSELVRRRGRWISSKVMEIYLQEVSVATYLRKLPERSRLLILHYAQGFESVLRFAMNLLESSIPPRSWYQLMRSQPFVSTCSMGADGKSHAHDGLA